ncbi:MAG: histidine kinase [Clostridia bacterium]|nr:histidine kinase [Clostridia bacterium]
MKPNLRNIVNLSTISTWLIIFIIEIICICILYLQSIDREQIEFSNELTYVHRNLEQKIKIGNTLLDSISKSPKTTAYFLNPNSENRRETQQSFTNLVQNTRDISQEHFFAVCIDKNNNISYMSDEISPQLLESIRETHSSCHEKNDALTFFTVSNALYNEVYFFLSRDIKIPSTDAVDIKPIGTCIVVGNINTAKLIMNPGSTNKKTYFFLREESSDKNDIVLTPKNYKNKEYFSEKRSLPGGNWAIHSSMPFSFPISIVLALLLLEIVLIPLMFIFTHRRITTNIHIPIQKILKFLNNYSLTNKGERINLQSQTEIGIIAVQIDQMVDNIEKLSRHIFQTQQRLYESEIAQKDAALYALQAQVNPHFIYNTLDCICGIANTSNTPEVTKIAVSLAKMLRYSTSAAKNVPLFYEIEIVENYLNIMAFRYPKQFTVTFDISEDVEEILCLKMLLQPIVENAFKHGVEGYDEKGVNINISATTEKNVLTIKISDTGRGIPKEKLDRINLELASVDSSSPIPVKDNAKIGLINIQNRIRLNYGNAYGLYIESKENEYTEVTLRLPRN